MEIAHPFRSLAACLAIASLVACGGGGGGSSALPSSGSGGSSGGTTAPAAVTNGHSSAASALNVTGNSLNVNQFGTFNGATVFAIRTAVAAHEAALGGARLPFASATPTCQNGVEFSQTGSGTGAITKTIEFFYDQLCTQPRKLIVMNITFTSTGGTSQGTETLYDQTGAIVDYKSDNLSFTVDSTTHQLTQISVEQTVAVSPSAAPFSQNGFTCNFGGSNAVDCGDANVATVDAPKIDPNDDDGEGESPSPSPSASPSGSPSASPSASPTASPTPFEVGFNGTLTGTIATPSPAPSASASPSAAPSTSPAAIPMDGGAWNQGAQQLQLTIAGNGYLGAVGSMSIAPGTPPAWTLTGGTQVSTLTGSGTLVLGDDDSIGHANVTLTDAQNGYTITLTSQGDHHLSGTVTNSSGQTLATIQVDDAGNGVIDYTSGATGRIRDWVVLS